MTGTPSQPPSQAPSVPDIAVSAPDKKPAMSYGDFINAWKELSNNPDASPREQAAARFYLKLAAMPDGEKRINHFLQRAMKARLDSGHLYLLGHEKKLAADAIAPLLEDKANRKALRDTMSPPDASESADLTRREWGGKVSRFLGWAMLTTLAGKQGLDHMLNQTAGQARQVQLRQLAGHIRDNPPPAGDPEAEQRYYRELDERVKGMIGTVRDQHPWLNVISAVGSGVLIHYGGKSREQASAAQNSLHERCARYTADIAGHVLEQAARKEAAAGDRNR